MLKRDLWTSCLGARHLTQLAMFNHVKDDDVKSIVPSMIVQDKMIFIP